MQLEQIHIKGFRGIADLDISGLGNINLIVGKNNCSKTSLLEAVFLLTGAGNPDNIFKINAFRNLGMIEADDFRLIYNNLDFETELSITGKYRTTNLTRKLLIKPGKYTSPHTLPQNGKHGLADFNASSESPTVRELVLAIDETKADGQVHSFSSLVRFENNEFNINPDRSFTGKQNGLYISTSNFALSQALEKALDKFIVGKQVPKLINVLRIVEPNLMDIQFGPNKLIYVDIGLDRLVPLNLMGDGLRRMLSIVLGMSYASDGVILIDEIDNGLHFSAMGELWKAIIKASIEFDVQVFATTHNHEAIQFLMQILAKPNGTDTSSILVKGITLRRLPDGNIKSYLYAQDQLQLILEQGIEFR
jgi:AAA domain, putative AbiEii toxin, Type IV TA system